MRVLVIGAGYVGLSMGVVLAKAHDVTLLDINEERVKQINQAICPIHEVQMPELLKDAIKNGKLRAVTDREKVTDQEIIFICTGTPSLPDGSVDMRQVQSAADYIFSNAKDVFSKYTVIVIKSTVPPGTTRKYILDRIKKEGFSDSVAASFNPEFLREGTAVVDALNPDRIIVGVNTDRGSEMMKNLYQECLGDKASNYLSMSLESAELAKYANNSFLATKISFSNEIANICESVPGVDFDSVMKGVGADHRINPAMFGAGAGYGGSCLPKDVSGLTHFAERLHVDTPILRAIQDVNLQRAEHIVNMLIEEIGELKGKEIGVLGIAFKPDTDDIRNSPGLRVIEVLIKKGAKVTAHDPLLAKINLEKNQYKCKFTDDLADCLQASSGCIIMTEWKDYVDLSLEELSSMMKDKVIIDGRRAFVKANVPKDVNYRTIGRPRNEVT